MLLEEFEVLTDETVREARRDTDLIDRKTFLIQENNTSKVLDIAFDGCLGVFRSAFDVREEISGEIEIEDLSFVSLSTTHFMPPTAGGKDNTILAHMAHVALDGHDAGGEYESDIFTRENDALIDRFIGDAENLVMTKTV